MLPSQAKRQGAPPTCVWEGSSWGGSFLGALSLVTPIGYRPVAAAMRRGAVHAADNPSSCLVDATARRRRFAVAVDRYVSASRRATWV